MTDAKPIASLTPTLLARKGGARPAMRSQLQAAQMGGAHSADEAGAGPCGDDLGYNDLGDDRRPGAEIVTLKRDAAETPAVRRQQEQLAARLFGSDRRRSALAQGRSAAFTLRLDADRHLKLRLACTLANCSAQQLVTDALDHMLASLPQVADLAARAGKRR